MENSVLHQSSVYIILRHLYIAHWWISIMYINRQGPNVGLMCTKSQKSKCDCLKFVVLPNSVKQILIYKFGNYIVGLVPFCNLFVCHDLFTIIPLYPRFNFYRIYLFSSYSIFIYFVIIVLHTMILQIK